MTASGVSHAGVDTSASKLRNPNLDAWRGVAVLMVIVYHMDFYSPWTRYGWAGVQVFFVLSGFLIAGLLFEERSRSGSISLKRFLVRRGLKIYPPFYALLVATLIFGFLYPKLCPLPVTARSLSSEALFVQNYIPGIWGYTWTLAAEEHFYVALPLLLILLDRRRKGGRAPYYRLPSFFAAVAIIDLAWRTGTNWANGDQQYSTHLRIDALLFGVLLAYYREFAPLKFEKLSRDKSGAGVIGGMAIMMILTLPMENAMVHTIGLTLIYLGFGLLIVATLRWQPSGSVATARNALARIGFYSYSIYLWHGAVIRSVRFAFGKQRTLESAMMSVALSLILGIAMSKIIEYPVLKWRNRIFPEFRARLADEAIVARS